MAHGLRPLRPSAPHMALVGLYIALALEGLKVRSLDGSLIKPLIKALRALGYKAPKA